MTAGTVTVIDIPTYSSTVAHKPMTMYNNYKYSSSSGLQFGSAAWANTAAISSMQFNMSLGPSASATTTFQLYGVS